MTKLFTQLSRQPEYLHVMINPLPIYGLAMGLLGLIVALVLRNRGAQIATLLMVLISTASAWPVYELGEQGYDRVLSMTDDDGHAWLDEHQHRAERLIPFFYALALLSAAAIVAPIKWRQSATALAVLVMLLGSAVLAMGGYIAYAGGKIRHREFRTGPPPKPTANSNAALIHVWGAQAASLSFTAICGESSSLHLPGALNKIATTKLPVTAG